MTGNMRVIPMITEIRKRLNEISEDALITTSKQAEDAVALAMLPVLQAVWPDPEQRVDTSFVFYEEKGTIHVLCSFRAVDSPA